MARSEAAAPESPACLRETLCHEPLRGRPPGNLPRASATFPASAPELTLTPVPLLPKCPHHAVGKGKPIRVGDNLHEDVHGIQYVCQGAVFAIVTDNLQARAEWGRGRDGRHCRLSSKVAQPGAAGRGGLKPSDAFLVQN